MKILSQPIPRIVKFIGADTPRAAELRQSSPFAGSLGARERREVLDAVEATLS